MAQVGATHHRDGSLSAAAIGDDQSYDWTHDPVPVMFRSVPAIHRLLTSYSRKFMNLIAFYKIHLATIVEQLAPWGKFEIDRDRVHYNGKLLHRTQAVEDRPAPGIGPLMTASSSGWTLAGRHDAAATDGRDARWRGLPRYGRAWPGDAPCRALNARSDRRPPVPIAVGRRLATNPHQASYLNESWTRARNATALPPSTFMSSLETSAMRRSRSDLLAVWTAFFAASSHDVWLVPITSMTR